MIDGCEGLQVAEILRSESVVLHDELCDFDDRLPLLGREAGRVRTAFKMYEEDAGYLTIRLKGTLL